jgi:HlyD family secretion protein
MNTLSRPRRFGIWIFLAVAVAGGTYYWAKHVKKTDVTRLDTVAVTRGDLTESISSTGILSASQEVIVGSQVSGIITKVLVDFNDEVKKGQLLAVVDPQTLQAQVDSSRAVLAQRQTAYDEAVRQLQEGKPLYEQKYLSDRDLRTLDVAMRTAKEQLQSAKVDFNKQNVQLKYAEIRSPIDGVIESRTVDPGNTVQASMTAPTLFVVASDLRKMKILANVDETQIASITEDMKARFTVSGIANKVFNATVRQIRLKPTTSNNVVTYTVVLDAENPDKLLFPGMTATIDFIQSSHENVLLVPSAALRVRVPNEMRVEADQQQEAAKSGQRSSRNSAGADTARTDGDKPQRQGNRPAGAGGKRNAVWMVDEQGKAYRVPVHVLGSDLTNAAVEAARPETHDLKEGDQVVTRVIQPSSASSAGSGGNNQNRGGVPGGLGGGFGGR